jgi:hypothetical protein
MPSLRRRARVDRLPGLFLAIRSRRDGLAERSRGGPYCRAKQAAQAAEVIVKTTGPSAKIATAMATMATAMATASAKPSMRDVLGLLIAFNSIARRHMHALHSGMDVKAYAASVGRAQPASRHPCRTAVVVAGAGPQSKRPPRAMRVADAVERRDHFVGELPRLFDNGGG